MLMLNFVILLEERSPTDLHKHFLRIIQSLNCNLWLELWTHALEILLTATPDGQWTQQVAPKKGCRFRKDGNAPQRRWRRFDGGCRGRVRHGSHAGIRRICSEVYSLYHSRILLCCLLFRFLLVQFEVLMCCAITMMGCMLGLRRRRSKSKSDLADLERTILTPSNCDIFLLSSFPQNNMHCEISLVVQLHVVTTCCYIETSNHFSLSH